MPPPDTATAWVTLAGKGAMPTISRAGYEISEPIAPDEPTAPARMPAPAKKAACATGAHTASTLPASLCGSVFDCAGQLAHLVLIRNLGGVLPRLLGIAAATLMLAGGLTACSSSSTPAPVGSTITEVQTITRTPTPSA